ncbi:type III secretion system chaperone [uncultured Shewanella sp.]|uniref:type III secretion system chaperone n=1 Tax=uncultured Shewanella sp. TaxID=173975 RepID=UPI0026201ED4|nr:type III secretion system chaperone [uncultured Shewanella sp.]
MTKLNNLSLIIDELGKTLNPDVIIHHNEQTWTITLSENFCVDVFYISDNNKVVFQSEIEHPNINEEIITKLLLQFNYNWIETGGVRMAQDTDSKSIIQIYDLFLEDLTLSIFIDALERFIEKAKVWSHLFELKNFKNNLSKQFNPII